MDRAYIARACITDRYIAYACFRRGVPALWLEDAVADVRVKMWRYGREDAVVIWRGAIEAARKYGARRRSFVRPVIVPLDNTHLAQDHAPRIDALIDRRNAFVAVWRTATEHQRACFLRAFRGTTMHDHTAHTHAKNLRKKMRRLAA